MISFKLKNKTISTNLNFFCVGIVNVTSDSFYEKSRGGVELAFKLISEGADILDIGAESTRPGFQEVSSEEEIKKLIPVIKEIRKKSKIPISIDTRKLDVIKECVKNGADIWNDITSLQSSESARFVADEKIPIILMHSFPFEREKEKTDKFILQTVSNFFDERILFASSHGVEKSQIIIDPGIGFGKTFEENITLIKNCGKICGGKYPVMMACSRKRVIGEMIGDMEKDRLEETIKANKLAIESGASFIRIHDVKEHLEKLKNT